MKPAECGLGLVGESGVVARVVAAKSSGVQRRSGAWTFVLDGEMPVSFSMRKRSVLGVGLDM